MSGQNCKYLPIIFPLKMIFYITYKIANLKIIVCRFKFYTDGIIGLIVAALGIIINALAMIMLARQRVQVTFHSLMIFLAIWDLLYLVISVLFFAMPVLSSSYYQDFFIPLVPFGLPIGQIFLTGSIYSTMALTIER